MVACDEDSKTCLQKMGSWRFPTIGHTVEDGFSYDDSYVVNAALGSDHVEIRQWAHGIGWRMINC
jgi:hypothetical protein